MILRTSESICLRVRSLKSASCRSIRDVMLPRQQYLTRFLMPLVVHSECCADWAWACRPHWISARSSAGRQWRLTSPGCVTGSAVAHQARNAFSSP
ncbi:hypothetical protein NI25_00040 [Streptomyces sp. CCM_MD2014]|nr:hypothetical protein NI25_00040 [Streptomyces sp. CCM_MD2014]